MDRPKRLAMGAAAEEIAREVRGGMSAAGQARSRIAADRRTAIGDSILQARPDDTVLITGRGDEPIQFVRGELIPLVDRDVALDALRRRNSRLNLVARGTIQTLGKASTLVDEKTFFTGGRTATDFAECNPWVPQR